MQRKIDGLISEIESLGYTIETFTNVMGTRFTYRLWKDNKLETDVNIGTWADLEPMYRDILNMLPKPPKICQSALYEYSVMCMGKVNHEGLHFATGKSGVHCFYFQWNSGVSWSKGQLAYVQNDTASRRAHENIV